MGSSPQDDDEAFLLVLSAQLCMEQVLEIYPMLSCECDHVG